MCITYNMQRFFICTKSYIFTNFVQSCRKDFYMAKAEYRSSIRSKKLITDALVELLDEKSLDKITVTDIVKRADINRGTFYSHYDNVLDVVNSIFETAFEVIKDSIDDPEPDETPNFEYMLKQLQSVMEENTEFFRKIYSSDINMKIYEQISNVLLEYILDREEVFSNVPHEDFVFYTSFYAGGIIKLYRDWFVGVLPITFTELTSRATTLLQELQSSVYIEKNRQP